MANGLIDYGLINPNVVNAFGAGYRDSQNERNALAQQDRANQLADMQLRSMQRGEAESQAESDAYKGSANLDEVQKRLMAAGLGRQSLAIGKAAADQQAAKLSQAKTKIDLMKSTATQIMTNPALAKEAVINFGKLTGTDITDELAQLDQLGGDQGAIKQWAAGHALEADKVLPKFEHFDQGGAIVTGRVNPVTGAFEQTGAVQKGLTPGERTSNALAGARLDQAERHFNAEQSNSVKAKPTFSAELGGYVMPPVNGRPPEFIPVAGLNKSTKPLTETQGNATAFGMRAGEANQILTDLENKGVTNTGILPSFVRGALGVIPYDTLSGAADAADAAFNAIPGGTTDSEKKTLQARLNFATAVLRKESGAAISPSEFKQVDKIYFPSIGDSKEVLKQKQAARETAIKALRVQAGSGTSSIDNHISEIAPKAGGVDANNPWLK